MTASATRSSRVKFSPVWLAGLACTGLGWGCAATPPLILVRQSHDLPDDPALRSPLLRGDGLGAAPDPWPTTNQQPPRRSIPGEPDPQPWLQIRLDGRLPVWDEPTGQWRLDGVCPRRPMVTYELAPWAGQVERLIILVAEYQAGMPVAETQWRISAATDLAPHEPFDLTSPGGGVIIRDPDGELRESFTLRPGMTYALWFQLQTSGRRQASGRPWPWPQVRFTTAASDADTPPLDAPPADTQPLSNGSTAKPNSPPDQP